MNNDPSMATAWAEMQHLMKTAEGRQLTREEADTFDTLEGTIRDARARKANAELDEDFAAVRISRCEWRAHRPAARTMAASAS